MRDLQEEREAVGVVMAAVEAGVEGDVEVLKAERGEEDEGGEDFAGSAGLRAAAPWEETSFGQSVFALEDSS